MQHQHMVNVSALIAGMIVVGRIALLGVDEPFPWMAEAGEVLYDLGLAWVTAWAFQLLVIVVPAERERRQFNDVIASRLDHLIHLGMQLSDAVLLEAGQQAGPFTVDGAALTKICNRVSLSSDAPGWASDWGGLLRHLAGRAERVRGNLRPFYSRLPSELLEALEQEEQAMDEIERMERFGRAFSASNMQRLDAPIFRWLTSIDMMRTVRAQQVAPERPLPESSPLDSEMVHVPMDDFIKQREEMNEWLKED